jgi:hypothetical protein
MSVLFSFIVTCIYFFNGPSNYRFAAYLIDLILAAVISLLCFTFNVQHSFSCESNVKLCIINFFLQLFGIFDGVNSAFMRHVTIKKLENLVFVSFHMTVIIEGI